MPPLTTSAGVPDGGLAERRMQRERAARKDAERLLNSKSLELYEALQASSHAQRLLELALWASSESIWEWSSQQDRIVLRNFPNDRAPTVRQGTLDRFVRRMHADDLDNAWLSWRMHLAGSADQLDMAVRYRVGRQWRWMRVRGKAVESSPDGGALRIVGTAKDITAHRDAEHSFRLMASAFASSRDAMTVLTQTGQIIEANRSFSALANVGLHEAAGRGLSHYVTLPSEALTLFEQSGYALCESTFQAAGRAPIPVEIGLSQFAGAAGSTAYLIATIRDITERKRAEAELEYVARHDALTGLPNRHTLQQHLVGRLELTSVRQRLGVLFMDLDGFKEVNDSLGHDAGDELLRIMAARLRAMLPEGDVLARWGGDEFVAVLTLGEGTEDAMRFARLLLAALRDPMQIRGHTVSLSGSLGIAVAPDDGADADALLQHADAAMYAAKHAGKDRIQIYHAGLAADALQRVTLLAHLRTAIEQDKLDFVLQPKFDRAKNLVGAELLARWSTTQHGVVSPAVFIPMAEQNGMAVALGRLAIERAAASAAALASAGAPLVVAVNISPLQMMDDRLSELLHQACRRHGILPAQLELEVTESVFLQDSDAPEQRLARLRAEGFAIAMDDFGTGYSSLGYLRRLPFDTIKIDRSFLSDVDQDEKSARLLAGIVNLCSALGIRTVAEGVETPEQFQLLHDLGVEQYQGYLLGRPMPLDSVLELVRAKAA